MLPSAQPLRPRRFHGDLQKDGFTLARFHGGPGQRLHWSPEPNAVEMCLNLEGAGSVQTGDGDRTSNVEIHIRTIAVYGASASNAVSLSRAQEHVHHFVLLTLNRAFLLDRFGSAETTFRDPLGKFLEPSILNTLSGSFAWVERMPVGVQNLTRGMIHPPIVDAAAQRVWYEAKVLELTAFFLVSRQEQPKKRSEGMFCSEQKRIMRSRVELARAILERDLENPPTLELLAAEVGCGPFHLSRIFSRESGMTIPQYLRQVRLERAAELLRAGRHNVTEAAFAVGYSSLSHFSKAFWERFGCCPGLYGNPKHLLADPLEDGRSGGETVSVYGRQRLRGTARPLRTNLRQFRK